MMETVCHSEGSIMSYPDVTPNATAWAWSDEKPKEETVVVTAHGLRRLLRVAKDAQGMAAYLRFGQGKDNALKSCWASAATPEKALELFQETSAIWCEGDLVMSRLFVTKDGKAIAHKDEEVDAAGIPPWERTLPPEQTGAGAGATPVVAAPPPGGDGQ